MAIPELPIPVQIANLEVSITNIQIAMAACKPRERGGFDENNKRDRLHREWDLAYDALIALRLRAYAEGIELAPATIGGERAKADRS